MIICYGFHNNEEQDNHPQLSEVENKGSII